MKRMMMLVMAILWGFAAGEVRAQEQPAPGAPAGAVEDRVRAFIVEVGAGFTNDPDMAAGLVSLDYYITNDIAVGPYFYFGGSGNNSYWGVAGQVKFSGALVDHPDLRPYAFIGIGFIEPDFENRTSEQDLTYFFPMGGGLEIALTDIIFLDVGTVFMVTEETFSGLTVGVRVLL